MAGASPDPAGAARRLAVAGGREVFWGRCVRGGAPASGRSWGGLTRGVRPGRRLRPQQVSAEARASLGRRKLNFQKASASPACSTSKQVHPRTQPGSRYPAASPSARPSRAFGGVGVRVRLFPKFALVQVFRALTNCR